MMTEAVLIGCGFMLGAAAALGDRYTVIDRNSGEKIGGGLTAADAAHIVLTDDGRQYDIRPSEDGEGFDLWSCQPVANRGWFKTLIWSNGPDRDAAETELFAKVIAANWPRHPEVLTDEQYAFLEREREAK